MGSLFLSSSNQVISIQLVVPGGGVVGRNHLIISLASYHPHVLLTAEKHAT